MSVSSTTRVLIMDAYPGKAITDEIAHLLKLKAKVTLNINKLKNTSFNCNLEGVNTVDFNLEDKDQVIQCIKHGNIGYTIIQLWTNILFDREIIETACSSKLINRLKLIAQPGVGTDHIDCEAATDNDVIVINTPGCNANAVAELIMGQMLALARNISYIDSQAHQGIWTNQVKDLPYFELSGKTLGIVGLGNTAMALIPKAQAFGMTIIGYSRSQKTVEGVKVTQDLHEVLKNSDIVSMHVPLTPETKNLIGSNELKIMKKGSLLINDSRGGVIDEDALASELKKPDRSISRAAVDTFANERSVFKTPLEGLSNVLLTSHLGGRTPESLEKSLVTVTECIVNFINNSLKFPVANKSVLKKYPE
ncbi:MAG: hypothetical protein JHC93_08355, partial [Parachlamydiales bacterium]|nr:hypothetical protein [Parachlamydiales bacterium]